MIVRGGPYIQHVHLVRGYDMRTSMNYLYILFLPSLPRLVLIVCARNIPNKDVSDVRRSASTDTLEWVWQQVAL
jgi:hypothetical protein